MSKKNKKCKKRYNANRQKMAQAKLVSDLAVDLEQIVVKIAIQKGEEGNLLMGEIRGIADWWLITMKKEDPTRHHIRLAARSAFLKIIETKAREQAKAGRRERVKTMNAKV